MFDFLKKRLKQAVDKVSKAISGNKQEQDAGEEIKETEIIQQPEKLREEIKQEIEKDDESVLEKSKPEKSLTEEDTEPVASGAIAGKLAEELAEKEKPVETYIPDEKSSGDGSSEAAKEVSEFEKEPKKIQKVFSEKEIEEELKKTEFEPEISYPDTFLQEREALKSDATPKKPEKEMQKIKEPEIKKIAKKTEELQLEKMPESTGEIKEEESKKLKAKLEVEEAPGKIEKEPEEKKGFLFGLLKKVTEKKLSEQDVEKFIAELKTALLENDVALETAESISSEVKESLVGKSVKRGEVETVITGALKHAILSTMQQDKIDLEKIIESNDVTLAIFFGFNGAGKTTTIAKMAKKFARYKPVVAAGDTFRAASIEQLEEHSKRIGFDLVKHKYGADSAAVIFDAKKYAQAIGSKLVLADTAGRSHSNANLMDELKKIVRVNKPDIKILVLDSVTGNDIYDQSRLFNDAVKVDGIILTKADVYERGGSALSAKHTIGKPILYLGTGQNYEDLEEFNPDIIVKHLLE